jgi:hypothetical protein
MGVYKRNMVKDLNINPENENDSAGLSKNVDKKNVESEVIPENEATKTLGDFAESVGNAEQSKEDSVNENVDFDEISGEIASKVLKNVEVQESATGRVDSAIDELTGRNDTISKMDEFLGDVGITKKQLYIFVVIILCFVMGVIVSFYYLLSLFSNDPDQIDPNVNPPQVEEPVVGENENESGFLDKIKGLFAGGDVEEEVDEKEDEEKVDGQSGVVDVGVIGSEKLEDLDSESIELINIIGLSEKADSNLSLYINTYREMRSVFNTDLFAYLSVVQDRESAYEEYLLRLKGNYEKSLIAMRDLQVEIDQYKQRLSVLEGDIALIEGQFFGEVEALNASKVSDLLVVFQELGRKEVVLTSELKARQAILDRYNGVESIVADQITAIELNKDAFIKGVQVVDYKNVDLDLIINN